MLPYRSELSILDFSSLRLIGREDEVERLEATFEAVMDTGVDEEGLKNNAIRIERCVFLAGKSGCGKTKLVDSLHDKVRQSGGTIVSGKFDQLSSTHPYSALVDAIAALCQTLIVATDEQVRSEIVRKLGSNLSLLHALVPSSRTLLKTEDDNGDTNLAIEQKISSQMFLRLKLMVGKLFQIIAELGPFVLFLDDLQWCDVDSIDIINSVLADEKLKNFLFIGAYRNDEITEGHSLFKLDGFGGESCTIEIKNLTEGNVNAFIATILNLEESSTLPLAREIHKKTAGNYFFVVQLLKLLESKNILSYSLSIYRWVWNMARITSEIESADNVAEVVANKIQILPFESQSALAIAACFGNKFDKELLNAILKALEEGDRYFCESSCELKTLLCIKSVAPFDVDQVLMAAVDEGFVDLLQSADGSAMAVHKFSHDKIQAAFYDLVKSSDTLRLHSLIGKLLFAMLPDVNPDQRDTLLFNVVEQLHRAGLHLFSEGEAFRVEVARLNLEAAYRVQRNAAFVTAVNYLQSGAALLGGDNSWSNHYQLTLETLNLKARMELCSRLYDDSQQTVSEILSKAVCVEDKIKAYITRVDWLGSETRSDEILQLVYRLVAQLGFRTPKRKAGLHHVVQQIMQTKRMVKRFSDDELIAYRRCDDPVIEGCLKLLAQASGFAILGDNMNDMAYIGMLMCYISLTKGFTKFSASSFVTLALAFAKMGDFKSGRRYGRLALQISDRFQAKECDGNILLLYYSFIHHTSTPMPELLDPLLNAYEMCRSCGEMESAVNCCGIYSFTYIVCGLPLSAIEKDTANFIDELKPYRWSAAFTLLRLLRQMVLSLSTRPSGLLRLEGEGILDLQSLCMEGSKADNKRIQEVRGNCQLYLSCYLGRGKEGQELVTKKFHNRDYPLSFTTFFPYLRGIVLLRLAREGCRGCRRLAAREIRRTRDFVRKGFINCTHLLLILEAGMLSISRTSVPAVQTAYDKAIACASRSGFTNDAGLASEHAAIYFRLRDPSRSSTYLNRAIEFYQQWGSEAKIEILEEEGARYDSEGAIIAGSAIRGRSRQSSSRLVSDHETTDWFASTTSKFYEGRQNLAIQGRQHFVQK